MQYRYFTKKRIKISNLGFGCMRFPTIDNDLSKIDEKMASEMLRFAIDKGVNYLDTAYPYHRGMSESFLGEFLSNNSLRDKVYLATKSPVWLVEKYEDFERLLDEQLERLKTNYIDFYLLHSLYKKTWDNIVNLKVFDFLEDARKKGKIKHIGFSFHDELPLFKEILDSYQWDFCQIQLNFLDTEYQAGLEGLKYAKNRDIDVIVMEPIKGGRLATASYDIQQIWDESSIKRSPAEWALKYIFDMEDVSLVLSGMSSMDQVVENIRVAEESSPRSLKQEEHDLISRVSKVYKDKIKVSCTGCEYCLPCPSSVAIPNIFELYNNIYVFGSIDQSKASYNKYKENNEDATKCVECGACEEICPQHLKIIKLLKEAEEALK